MAPLAAALTTWAPAEASACNSVDSARLMWPRPDESNKAPSAPTDTEIWVEGYMYRPTLTLEGPDGEPVPFDTEVASHESDLGPLDFQIRLVPRDDLAPDTTYTVRAELPADGEGTRIEFEHEFTTTSGARRVPPEPPPLEYVAMEREERYMYHCDERHHDTVHTLGVTLPDTGTPHHHVLLIERPGEPIEVREFFSQTATPERPVHVELFDATLGADTYPCVIHVLRDVSGQTVRNQEMCAPAYCVEPPSIRSARAEGYSREWGLFVSRRAGPWSDREVPCAHGGGAGCSVAPGSQAKPSWWLLGLLACVVGLRTTRRRR
jgi:hypothetical protein